MTERDRSAMPNLSPLCPIAVHTVAVGSGLNEIQYFLISVPLRLCG